MASAGPLGVLAFSVAVGVGVAVWKASRVRQRATERLLVPVPEEAREGDEADADEAEPLPLRPFVRRHYLIPIIVGLGLAAGLTFGLGVRQIFAFAAFAIVTVLLTVADSMRVANVKAKIETQLGDSIDLIVGSLRAGAGLLDSLDSATRETPEPLKTQLAEVAGKIRLGEDPQVALRELVERVPLESFRLFTMTLAVNWEVGGSLAPSLATVGRTIRDRLELSRRIRTQSTNSRGSVMAILGVTYFVAVLMWRSAPHRMEEFLATSFGSNAVGFALIMQAGGLIWMAFLSEIEH